VTDGWRVLVTGIAGALAAKLVRRLADDDGVDLIVGVDERLPVHDLGRTRIVRVELTSPVVGSILERERIDTLVHLDIASSPQRRGGRGRARMKEHNVIGTMQLLVAAQRSPYLRTAILKSSTAVYGSDAGNRALFGEDVATEARTGFAKDVIEAEGYARTLARRRDGVVVTVLRFANVLGSQLDSTFARYLALPVIPTVLGYDPRLQLCHTEDAVEVLRQACLDTRPGIYNVAGPGVLYLSQAARMAGRPTFPVPLPMAEGLVGTLRRVGMFTPTDQLRFLEFGRVADISRLRERFGYEPRYSTRETLQAFLDERGVKPLVERSSLERLERRALEFGRAITSGEEDDGWNRTRRR
jgi:UDP-glucose 4-epimerase